MEKTYLHTYLLKNLHRYLRKNLHCYLPFTIRQIVLQIISLQATQCSYLGMNYVDRTFTLIQILDRFWFPNDIFDANGYQNA